MKRAGVFAFLFLSTLISSCDSTNLDSLQPNSFNATLRGDLNESIEGAADIVNVILNDEPRFAFRLRYDGQELSGSGITGIAMRFTSWNNLVFDEGAYSVVKRGQPQLPGTVYFNITTSPNQGTSFFNLDGRGTLTIERKPDTTLVGSFNIDINDPNLELRVSGTFNIVLE